MEEASGDWFFKWICVEAEGGTAVVQILPPARLSGGLGVGRTHQIGARLPWIQRRIVLTFELCRSTFFKDLHITNL